jgi:hypothetical protein
MMTADTTPESSEYTPTDREFRDWIVVVDTIGGHGGESIRRFDRWLAAHDEEVARKALTDAADAYKSGQLTGVFMGRDDYAREWLRARAEQIGEH